MPLATKATVFSPLQVRFFLTRHRSITLPPMRLFSMRCFLLGDYHLLLEVYPLFAYNTGKQILNRLAGKMLSDAFKISVVKGNKRCIVKIAARANDLDDFAYFSLVKIRLQFKESVLVI